MESQEVSKQIKDRTVKEIFSRLLGPEIASDFLMRVQKKYDSGVHGDELEKFAWELYKEYKIVEPESVKLAVAVIAIIVI